MYTEDPRHVSTFITEFSETLNTVHERSKKAYISEDFNIDLLKIYMNSTFNTFFENKPRILPENYKTNSHK